MGSTKVHYTLSDEAIAIVNRLAESPNKRGEWVSNVIIDYVGIMEGTARVTGMGALEVLGERLEFLEKQIAALMRELKATRRAYAEQ